MDDTTVVPPHVKRRRRLIRRSVLGVFLVVVGYAGVTMYPYLTAPGTDPVSGRVAARNDALTQTPELLNSDPYGAGWLMRVDRGSAPLDGALLKAAEYTQYIKEAG